MYALETVRDILEANGDIAEYRNANKSLAIVDNSSKILSLFKKIIQKIQKLFYINKRSIDIEHF